MLLRHTDAEVKERSALTVNPAKTCQPVGAMYAALGVHGCLPHSHGSQGCCAYHRSALTRHYKEPVMAATSSFTEGASVFGGQANLLQSIQTIFQVYDPEVIAVHTTCLSETIGDDITQITCKANEDGKIPPGKVVFHANTPSYVGSHVTGFANMVVAMVRHFATSPAEGAARPAEQINLLPGWVEPSDMAEVKRMAALFDLEAITMPDTSGVFDAPQTGRHAFYPDGGVTLDELRRAGFSSHSVALGPHASEPAATLLLKQCGVPATVLELPIGLQATDRYIDALRTLSGLPVPASLNLERGQLLDMISDNHQYFAGKRVALWGDPDQLVSLTEFMLLLDMEPAYIVTGTPGKSFMRRLETVLGDRNADVKVRQGAQADMFLMHQWIKEEPVDLLIGNTYGKYIARDDNIPLLRHGFPIFDRVGHNYFPTVGYRGGMRLLEKMLDLFFTRQDRESPEESFELVL